MERQTHRVNDVLEAAARLKAPRDDGDALVPDHVGADHHRHERMLRGRTRRSMQPKGRFSDRAGAGWVRGGFLGAYLDRDHRLEEGLDAVIGQGAVRALGDHDHPHIGRLREAGLVIQLAVAAPYGMSGRNGWAEGPLSAPPGQHQFGQRRGQRRVPT